MSTFTVSLNPGTVTVGQATGMKVTENAFDAAGEALSGSFVGASLSAPVFTVSVVDSTGLSTASSYSGVGSGPITYAVQTPNYPTATASLAFVAASPVTTGYALTVSLANYFCNGVLYYSPGSSATPLRQYCLSSTSHPRFDATGTLWGVASIGIKPDGTSAGTLGAAGTVLGFDADGKAYIADPVTNAVDVYSGGTLMRQINVPGTPVAAAVDPSGNVYVGISAGSAYEYGPIGTGSILPMASSGAVNGAVATDGSGNVYTVAGSGPNEVLAIWQAGTFGSSAPARTIATPASLCGTTRGVLSCTSGVISDFGVDSAGDIYAIAPGGSGQGSTWYAGSAGAVYYSAAGSSGFLQLGQSGQYISVPIGIGSSQGTAAKLRAH